jgi:hypothetical protein
MVGPDWAELFVYPGDAHLFVDSSLPTYDADAVARQGGVSCGHARRSL